jgi:type IX secretion system PorP/SprF family membrane protein
MLVSKPTIWNLYLFCTICFLGISQVVGAQEGYLSTQYMNNQLLINPAYAGVRNAFHINALVRQQWLGVEGAPTTYALSVHSPINKRMMSLGATLKSYQAGPVMQNQLSAVYSHLVRINHQFFVSMGLNASVYHHNVGLSSMDLIHEQDPSFMSPVEDAIHPNFGGGLFLYSPNMYFGLSALDLMEINAKTDASKALLKQQVRSFYATAGYGFSVNESFYLKPSFLIRHRSNLGTLLDINSQVFYKELFWLGVSYRINQTVASMLSLQLGKGWSLCYSYDFSTNWSAINQHGSHELTISIDSQGFIKRNKDRQFRKKKVETTEEGAMRSIRYF